MNVLRIRDRRTRSASFDGETPPVKIAVKIAVKSVKIAVKIVDEFTEEFELTVQSARR